MTSSKRALLGVLGGAFFALFFVLFLFRGSGGEAESPPTTEGANPCTETVHYFRHDLPENDNRFGEGLDWPAWQANMNNDLNGDGAVDVKDLQIDLHNDRCVDPALTVAHAEYAQRSYTNPEERLARTQGLADNRQEWLETIATLEAREATATKVEVVLMSEAYQTLYMTNTHPIPSIYQDALDRPEYWVLRFTYADGTVDNYKLDCNYQPVEPEFPGIPGRPVGHPTPTVPTGVSTTTVPGVSTTVPPTTCPSTVCKGSAPPAPPPCVDSAGKPCTVQPGAGGQPGTGGAVDHGDDGYSPSDPPPSTVVPPKPPPTSVVTLPPTTAPPPPTSIVIPG